MVDDYLDSPLSSLLSEIESLDEPLALAAAARNVNINNSNSLNLNIGSDALTKPIDAEATEHSLVHEDPQLESEGVHQISGSISGIGKELECADSSASVTVTATGDYIQYTCYKLWAN